MDPPASNGPDGSSIKPVSSLRAKFENMTKPGDTPTGHPPPPGPRPVSPASRPDGHRDPAPQPPPPTAREPPTVPKMRPKDKLHLAGLQSLGTSNGGMDSPSSQHGHAPLSPRPVPPPSLLIEPPQSPPKKIGDALGADRVGFLNTDSLVKPQSPATGPRNFKIPSRPHTPIFEPRTPVLESRKSPRLTPSQPPSPPPPRRSMEMRREREVKEAKPLPPPVNRAEKPLIPSRSSYLPDAGQALEIKTRLNNDKVSPFNSPPSSNGTPEDESPPMLPTRPRPPIHQSNTPPETMLARSKTFHAGGFEPPPLHHSLVNRRREREETNGTERGPITPQISGDQPPALPARPHQEPPRISKAILGPPPPRPPRPGLNTSNHDVPPPSQKRVSSTPTTTLPPPPPRTHGRSMTIDRLSSRAPGSYRGSQATIPAPVDTPLVDPPPSGPSRAEDAAAPTIGTFPDTSNTNRSKPYPGKGAHEISTRYDARFMDVCGDLVCTTGQFTRAWRLSDGEQVMSLSMGEGMKGTAVIFKPGANVDEEGERIWIGNNSGELMEADIATQSIVSSRAAHNRYEILKIYRHFNDLWTLDDSGTLHVWNPDEKTNTPSLVKGPSSSFRVTKGHTFSMVVVDELWLATGREIRVYMPGLDSRGQFQVLLRPLVQDGVGEVTSGTMLTSDSGMVFFGHADGKITIYSSADYSCLGVMNISGYKISTLAGVGQHLWAGFNTGRVSVYDMGQTPWAVKKDWQAHDSPVVKVVADPASMYKLDRYQVISLGGDNMVRAWDGLLQEDWLSGEMKNLDTTYCTMEKLKVLVLTWNAGASTPNSLRYSDSDAGFFQNFLQSSGNPDIVVFGFQELVDLEDKTATAKRFLKPKKKEKKEGTDQERMSHQYRDWRDFLARCLDDYMSGNLYQLLHTAPLVGLFTCIFVKADLRDRISHLSSAEVKRGMGGLHGNKGAILVRFKVDDSSLCFINCHLAAGQSGANQRHNDIAAILEATVFPSERDPTARIDSYVGGGDGSMVLDHELCLLNGDLNYRIDTMSRDTVVMAVKTKNLAKLLDRDQLLVARRRNPGFRLRAFDEMAITFDPTYKYDVGTDTYDSSEKKRSPAWCDRLLYRSSRGRIEQLDYKRHEVRVSDHRPVSGRFRFTVKRIDPKLRAEAWVRCLQGWEDLREKEAMEEKIHYLTRVIGYDKTTAQKIILDRSKRRLHRSPSRHGE